MSKEVPDSATLHPGYTLETGVRTATRNAYIAVAAALVAAAAAAVGWASSSEAQRLRVALGAMLMMLGHRVYTRRWVTMGYGLTASAHPAAG